MKKRRLVVACVVLVAVSAAAAAAIALAATIKGRQPAALVAEASAAYQKGDWSGTEKKARDRLKKKRDDRDALRLLARALFRQGRDQPATAISEKLPASTMTAEDYFLLGQACVRSQKLDVAIKVWQRAVQIEPGHFETLLALEQTLYRLGRLADAESEVKRMRALPGREGLADLMLGQIRVQQADKAGAIMPFEGALKASEQWSTLVDPVVVVKQLARCLLETGQGQRARERLLSLGDPAADSETCWLIARCDLQQSVPTESTILGRSRAYRAGHLMESEPAPYVGAARCAGCHAEIAQAEAEPARAHVLSRRSTGAAPLSERANRRSRQSPGDSFVR